MSESSATAVSPDGTTASFNFPQAQNGGAIAAGIYRYGLFNQQSTGLQNVGHGLVSIGAASTLNSPYGVDAADTSSTNKTCTPTGDGENCTLTQSVGVVPIFTQYSSNQVAYFTCTSGLPLLKAATLAVGSEPVAVKLYGASYDCSVSVGLSNYSEYYVPTAIVVNSGSNSVSFVNFVNNTSTSVAVGTQPMAVILSPDETLAYVANYGSGTVSQVNLSSKTVTGTVSVGANPASLTLDPGGTAFWVGGLNYISEVNTSNLSVAKTYTVSGQVTSLAIAGQQNALLYTLVTNTNFQIAQSSLSTGAFVAAYAQSGCENCEEAPTPLIGNGIIVAANYSNNAVVAATPTGFVVIDLSSQTQVLQGSTATPVVGIASDPAQGMVYLTVPGSNSALNVPLPPIAAN
jgi:YVTN family beta-propeller protein